MASRRTVTWMCILTSAVSSGRNIMSRPVKFWEAHNAWERVLDRHPNLKVVKGGFFGGTETRGLALPTDVLEIIYYRNAARLYPRVKNVLRNLGYVGND